MTPWESFCFHVFASNAYPPPILRSARDESGSRKVTSQRVIFSKSHANCVVGRPSNRQRWKQYNIMNKKQLTLGLAIAGSAALVSGCVEHRVVYVPANPPP